MDKSSTNYLISTLFSALALSLFIYLEHFEIANRTLVSAAAFFGVYTLLVFDKKALAISGFLTGLLWFYWIGLSFRYVDMAWAVPLVAAGIALVYGLFFWLFGFIRPFWARAVVLLVYFDLLAPLGFEWFKPEVLLVNSFFGITKLHLGLFILSVGLFIFLKGKRYRPLFLLPLLFALKLDYPQPELDGNIKLVTTDYAQDEKWDVKNMRRIVNENMDVINKAIDGGKEAVVLPESVFPMYLNRYPEVVEYLMEKSKAITIIAGALYSDGKNHFNSTYFFQNGTMQVAHKVVLVPFAESSDFLPEFLGRLVNKIFFDGAEDYRTAVAPTDFEIGGKRYRNAICYEASVGRMYENAPDAMIAITNNAWYEPSTEPALQRVVIRYFSRLYGVTVYHAVNKSTSEILY